MDRGSGSLHMSTSLDLTIQNKDKTTKSACTFEEQKVRQCGREGWLH